MDKVADFFCDLDRTLIYSSQIPHTERAIPVEYRYGDAISFISEATEAYLRQSLWFRLIPVTARSPEQFLRLSLFHTDWSWYCGALVCNGGILLKSDGTLDQEWYNETLQIASAGLEALPEALYIFRQFVPEDCIRFSMGLMLCARCEETEENGNALLRHLTVQPFAKSLRIIRDRRKIYCYPRTMNKGSALCRYQIRFGQYFSIAAGDGAIDVPMLDNADVVICPEALSGNLRNRKQLRFLLPEIPALSGGLRESLEKIRIYLCENNKINGREQHIKL